MKIKKIDHVFFTCSLFIFIYTLSYSVIFLVERNLTLSVKIKFPPLINSMGPAALIAVVMFPIAYKKYFKKMPSGKFLTVNRTLFISMAFIALILNTILLVGSIFYVTNLLNPKNGSIIPLLFLILFLCVQLILITSKISKYLKTH